MTNLLIISIAIAFAASLLVTPLVRRLALRLGIVDHPDTGRKLHSRSTPLGGGLAVLAGFVTSILALSYVWDTQTADVLWDPAVVTPLLIAMLMICVLGLIDDRFELRGRQKLVGQFFAATVLIGGGLVIQKIAIFGLTIELGLLAIPFTLLWLLGAINALNLLDGMDGLATSLGIVLSVAFGGMALITGHTADAVLTAAMVGALVGFLIYNFPPASIFLGDAGSMLIGLFLGALAIRSSLKGPATVALAAPVAVWAIPILDVSMAVLRRKLTGRSIYATDRGHLHHSFLRRGMSTVTTVVIIGILCAITAIAAVVSVYTKHEMLAVGTVAAVVATLAIGRMFGHQEFILLLKRTKHFVLSLVPFLHRENGRSHQLQTRLQGTRQWDEIWETLTTYAETLDLDAVQLNVCLPGVGEDYHARWERNGKTIESQVWYSEIPLFVDEMTVGRLKIVGHCNNGNSCDWIGDLISGLKPFEAEMRALIEDTVGDTACSDFLEQNDTDGGEPVQLTPQDMPEA